MKITKQKLFELEKENIKDKIAEITIDLFHNGPTNEIYKALDKLADMVNKLDK